MNRIIFLSSFFLLLFQFSFAQTGVSTKLYGKVTDAATGSPVVGASVVVAATQAGSRTDVEGSFFLQVTAGETYTIEISSVGYQTKVVSDVKALAGDNSPINIAMTQTSAELNAVVVTTSARKGGTASLYMTQKNASAISDAISAEVIRKSPDRNTSEVLRRVSGASIQDNKFVIIRGLSERYNSAMLNNSVLPSTEPDKKAFSFDILPSSLIDNITIYKSATPDLPGDFAGGAVKVSTKDYPSKKVSELSASVGYNSLTTFKNFYKGYPQGKTDWLGYFDDKRLIPGSYYANRGGNFINLSDAAKTAVTKQFSNSYGYEPAMQSQPNLGISYTGGNTKLLGGSRKLGYIYSVGYNHGRRVADRYREEFEQYAVPIYNYNTVGYDMRSTLSGLLNVTYSYGKSKISLKNLYNNDFVKTLGVRNGTNVINGQDGTFFYKSTNSEATANGILNSVLEGMHKLNNDWNLDWNASYGMTYRWQPDQRILAFRTFPENNDAYFLTLSNENSPEITNAGRVYSFLKENIYGANLNATKQFEWLGQTQKLKMGASNYYRNRDVEVHALGFSVLNSYGNRVQIPEAKDASYNTIFSPANIDAYHLTMANISANSADYQGTGMLNAGYVMLDNKFSDKLKLTWGVRAEQYLQKLSSPNRPDVTLNNLDILPSGLFTYSLNNKTNFRLAASQSVNRPEFRELATYRVFDYDNYVIVQGNDQLKRSKATNADLRYEWFPAAGEIVSASLFYKHFNNPIEQTNLGNDVFSFANATNAQVFGVELELRKRLGFIGGDFFDHFTFSANAAYIKGAVKFGELTFNSPMQGQSPYLINSGLTYSTDNDDLSFNILYNRVGPRLKYRAIGGAGKNVYEKPRDVIDASISKKLFKNRAELRLTVADLLANNFVWYYKFDANPSNIEYNAATDRVMNSYKYGSTTSLSLRFNLGK